MKQIWNKSEKNLKKIWKKSETNLKQIWNKSETNLKQILSALKLKHTTNTEACQTSFFFNFLFRKRCGEWWMMGSWSTFTLYFGQKLSRLVHFKQRFTRHENSKSLFLCARFQENLAVVTTLKKTCKTYR